MTQNRFSFLILSSLLFLNLSCSLNTPYLEDFDQTHDRTWVNEHIYTIPLEDWMVDDGKLVCTGKRNNMRAVLLTHLLDDSGEFLMNLRMGLDSLSSGSGGLILGMQDDTDSNIKSLAYFGTGINVGVDADRTLFVGEVSQKLPTGFNLSDFHLHLDGLCHPDGCEIRVEAEDLNGVKSGIISKKNIPSFAGAISLVSNHASGKTYSGKTGCWFDDIHLTGTALIHQPENAFGAILWTMYTLSKNTLKLTVQMPPIGERDSRYVELQFEENGSWKVHESVKIKPDSRTALFRVDGWDDSRDAPYRIQYNEKGKDGNVKEHVFEGTIRRDPQDKPLVVGGLTCQYHYGFPYRPLTENLARQDPDLLYFSGDQLYEGNGGYGIIRFPADSAILNYLGKWYMFGWAFREVMKDRPVVTIPDDHDVFQGNLWGEGGKKIEAATFGKLFGTSGGFVQPIEMVRVVHETNSAHLPDPYDPSPMEQGLTPYYTELVYGNVSFAIIGDRMFKSGPASVANWEGRQDWLREKLPDMSVLDQPGLSMLGNRQMNFLSNWAQDWSGARMKCVLSQTVFANIATHHGGNKEVFYADLDSGGWPQTPRNKAVEVMRKAFAFHIAGDQHLPTLSQYGTNQFRDAGWAFCTPAITVYYERRFKPEELGYPIFDQPEHGLPHTGKYRDPFGHPMYLYAVGNPDEDTRDPNRYQRARKTASGYGLITFDTQTRTIVCDAIRFDADLQDGVQETDRFPGWPATLNQTDNYGRERFGHLPVVSLDPQKEYLQLYDQRDGSLVYAIRPASGEWAPFVFQDGRYTIRLVHEETGEVRELKDLQPSR